ncbi:MAG: DUF805 domain-containing protein [Gammaproteobacteria bacterium]
MASNLTLEYVSQLYFRFEGRIDRQTFILGIGAWSLFLLIFRAFFVTFAHGDALLTGIIFLCLLGFVLLTTGLALFALLIKRLHDLGYSGWWSLLIGVPIVNFVFLLLLIFKKGQI